MAKKGRIEVNAELCKGCMYCVENCPQKIIKIGQKQNIGGHFYAEQADPDKKCNACKICGTMCPEAAIEVFEICNCADCNCEENKEASDG